MGEMLKIENIRKVFNPGTINEKVALDGVDLTLEEGEFVTGLSEIRSEKIKHILSSIMKKQGCR